MDSHKAYWAVGFLSEFSIYVVDGVEFEEDIESIINDEIIYLLRWYLDYKYSYEGEEIDEEEIRSAICAGQEVMEGEEDLKQLVKNVQNRLELVKDAFDIDRLMVRYKVKQDTVHSKLFDFNYNVYAQNLLEEGYVNFAFVNMICKKNLRGIMQGEERFFVEHEQGESVAFICDEEDIDMLIAQLMEIKRKIKGELQ